VIAFEDQIEQGIVVEVGAEAPDRGSCGHGYARSIEQHDGDSGARLSQVPFNHSAGERRRVGLEEMKEAGHQNTTKRLALATSAAMPSGVMGVTGCPSAFQDLSAGGAPSSTWKGTASYYDLEVNGKRNPAAAWYYPDPKPAAKQIKDHVAFWKGVTVEK